MMHAQINQLVKSLFQKDSLEECSVQELQEFADRHPFFGAAQLLLTKKLKAENSDRYNSQLQKTFLFFHNPLWVENLLSDAGEGNISMPESEPLPLVNEVKEEIPETKVMTEEEVVQNSEKRLSHEFAENETEENPEPEITEEVNAPPLSIAAIKNDFSSPVVDTELVFEPYHTVDYFASQGIQMKEENKPEDKFGRQLKSFTAWLKTMKRLPVSEIVQNNEPATEEKVEQLAEHSIKERDVITEAMAQVWEKQGNIHKATAIYQKLSLLEPSKNAYFAAKIEDLKKIS